MTRKRALFIQHDHVSPTGPIGERLREHGYDIVEFGVVTEDNFKSPNVVRDFPNLDDYDLIVPMGAPWGAWDDACIGNWLQPELDWIRQAVTTNKPVFAICFGGQLVARAMGGSVAPGPRSEIGWTNIWSDDQSLVSNGPWFQFHFDRWVVPPGAVEIARNPVASQAFTINKTLAMQFHPEVSYDTLDGWLVWGGDKVVEREGMSVEVLLAQTKAEEAAARKRAHDLVDAFFRFIEG